MAALVKSSPRAIAPIAARIAIQIERIIERERDHSDCIAMWRQT